MITSAPDIRYPPELPVSARRDELLRVLGENQVVIVAGETGSGKTTQLPKMLLELGCERIAHTQPRRIAARSIAERIAEELGVELGGLVGYQVRFTDRSTTDTRLKLMTDGVLLAELSRDRELRRYDAIIIDEAHERSLTIDFLLGYLRQLLPRRPDLRVIVTSATIDPESFARHFALPGPDGAPVPAPIVEVSGRTFPVDIRYRPLDPADSDDAGSAAAGSSADPGSSTADSRERRPQRPSGGGAGARDQTEGIVDALDELARESSGDVLVFLTGENEIRDAEDAVRGRYPGADTEILPLYGRLSGADQHRVFGTRPPGVRRRIVLATNVAETSLTVPGIRYVIDAGTARISRYSPRAKVQRLPIEPISRASADQRAGRAGRTSDGIAIRLYSRDDLESRPAFTDPEVLRTNLAAVILQMVSLGLGDIAAFPFLQPPDSRGIKDGLDLLAELGAIERMPAARARRPGTAASVGVPPRNSGEATAAPAGTAADAAPATRADGERSSAAADAAPATRADGERSSAAAPRITRIGRDLARLPVDPRFGRMLVEARRHGVAGAVTAIVAALSIQDPRERPLERRQQADAAHARFADPTSDFLTLLNLWNHLAERQRELGSSAFRRLCRDEFLNYLRVREWQDLVRQLSRALGERAPGRVEGVDGDLVHRSLLPGLLSRIGVLDERAARGDQSKARGTAGPDTDSGRRRPARDYLGARGQRFTVFPGSALSRKPPAAVMAAELVETSRLFARTVGGIRPEWAEELAGDLVVRQHSDPHWEQRRGAAVVRERVTLFGVPLVVGRAAQLARIDRPHARELFIRHALVAGEWPRRIDRDRLYDFDRENRAVRLELEEVEERTRRRDVLVDDEAIVDFYDARLPQNVATVQEFEAWWRVARRSEPGLLTLRAADLHEEAADVDEQLYPSEWRDDDRRLALDYRFEPGADDDGVTVEVPLPVLPRVDSAGLDWLVPGMRDELVTALIRTLPKAIRRHVVPAADWARRLSADLPDVPDGILTERLASAIRRQAQVPVDAGDFDPDRLPPHLRVTYAVVDERGRRIRSSKDLAALQSELAAQARASVAAALDAATSGARLRSTVTAGAVTSAPGKQPPPRGHVSRGDAPAAKPTASAQAPAPAPAPATGPRLERTGLRTFDLDELPEAVDTRHGGSVIRGYPALVMEPGGVGIRVLGTAAEQRTAHARGIRELLHLGTPDPSSYVLEHLTATEKLALATSRYPSTAALMADALAVAIDERVGDRAPRTRADFEALRGEVASGLLDRVFAVVGLTAQALDRAREADRAISSASALAFLAPLSDARAQLDALIAPGFIGATGAGHLRRLPVYLAGIVHRVTRLAENPGRDRAWQTQVDQATELFREAGGAFPLPADAPEPLPTVRWMLEELRLSLFAQHLGTSGPVSVQRIRRALSG